MSKTHTSPVKHCRHLCNEHKVPPNFEPLCKLACHQQLLGVLERGEEPRPQAEALEHDRVCDMVSTLGSDHMTEGGGEGPAIRHVTRPQIPQSRQAPHEETRTLMAEQSVGATAPSQFEVSSDRNQSL